MVNKTLLSLIFLLPMNVSGFSSYGDEPTFPAVQLGGDFYQYPEAVRIKGGRLSKAANGKYIVSFGSENVSVETNGTGLASVRSSLFPETVLVNFSFTDTLGSAKTFINAKGPIPSIRIYKNGNGQGSVYLSSSAKGQKIELKKDKKQIAGYFDVGNANHVSCSGREKLECHEP